MFKSIIAVTVAVGVLIFLVLEYFIAPRPVAPIELPSWGQVSQNPQVYDRWLNRSEEPIWLQYEQEPVIVNLIRQNQDSVAVITTIGDRKITVVWVVDTVPNLAAYSKEYSLFQYAGRVPAQVELEGGIVTYTLVWNIGAILFDAFSYVLLSLVTMFLVYLFLLFLESSFLLLSHM